MDGDSLELLLAGLLGLALWVGWVLSALWHRWGSTLRDDLASARRAAEAAATRAEAAEREARRLAETLRDVTEERDLLVATWPLEDGPLDEAPVDTGPSEGEALGEEAATPVEPSAADDKSGASR